MTHESRRFIPAQVDEQIAHLLPDYTTSHTRLVQDLHGYYQVDQQQDLASLERAWQRVSRHLDQRQAQIQPTADPPSPAHRPWSIYEKADHMLPHAALAPTGQHRQRVFSLLAALLVIALLVGSLISVLYLSHRTGRAGSPDAAHATPTSVPLSPGTIVSTLPGIDTGGLGFISIAWSPASSSSWPMGTAASLVS